MTSKIKKGIDLLMMILLLGLMAYQITGQALHEWFGAGMLVLLVAHNVLNRRWYGSLYKGKYKLLRIVTTIINFSILIDALCLGFSGIVMSRYVFAALPINGPMASARTMHMAASYWGFVLMSIHVGVHGGMMAGRTHGMAEENGIPGWTVWLMWLSAFVFAGYGAVCFVGADIPSYMFLKNQFVFFDFEKSIFTVFLEYTAMMELWILIGYYMTKGIRYADETFFR
ncbi:MAG: DUF4405 domain-containing protein [Lachnospiraceae bacterium]|nr:DUF4405 domain-containing protein [Lachnospiraceae bacterium]